jgi:DNA-binding HxlR family transcriptional regulator
VAPNVLAERLRRLERAGLVRSEAYSTRPRRLVYALTPAGDDAAQVLPALAAWAARHAGGGELPRHEVCGTPLEVVAWCPACRVPADDGETIHHV